MSLQALQEHLQQQLSIVKAACKASDTCQVQLQLEHNSDTAKLTAQLEAAQQQAAELESAHQQALTDHLATAEIVAQQERDVRLAHTHQAAQLAAIDQLQLEVATAAEEAEGHMAAVAADFAALQQAHGCSQAELRQELQQVQSELIAWQQQIAVGDEHSNTDEIFARLVQAQQQLAGRGCTGLLGLVAEHQRISLQVCHGSSLLSSNRS